MTRAALVGILILFSISSANLVETLVHNNFGKFLGTLTAVKQVKIPELLNQLCNQSQQGTNANMRRDACYGCFFRASILPQGFSMLAAMSTCADEYLNNTSYGHCQTYLRNATSMPNTRSPMLIYCSFLECIRQVNKNSLGIQDIDVRGSTFQGITQIKQQNPFLLLKILAQKTRVKNNSVCIIRETNLRECVDEAARMLPNFNISYANYTNMQLAQLFVNTTACVLAKTRCSYMNPVTGELHDDDIVNKLHLPSLNAVLVNTDYDINIVQLPFRHGSVDVCTKYRNVQQATWPSVEC